MIRNRFVIFLLALCSLVALTGAVAVCRGIRTYHTKPAGVATARAESEFSASFALVEKALALPSSAAPAPYSGSFESPFKTITEGQQSAAPVSRREPSAAGRPKLVLKGILYKSSALAIMEDAGGKTSILGVGDTIAGQTISAIAKTSVVFRDKRGTWELFVKE
ncbi:MAG TPA: hypothetical protein VKF42_07660 [Chitinivibrionales bacterium]|jgi:hypothetical protein|nr:hypothetical protein [Chitinivibrionales bacterium]